MPIEVRYDRDTSIDGIIAYLAAQNEERKRQWAEQQQFALQQSQSLGLPPLIPIPELPGQAPLEQVAPEAGYGGGRGGYAGGSGGGSRAPASSFGTLASQILEGGQRENIAAMEMQAQMAEQQAMQERQSQTAQMQADAQLRNKSMGDMPEEIMQGLQAGKLAYSPEQKTEMRELQDSIAKARRNPNLTPQQLMQFEAKQAQQLRSVRSSPMVVPPDEWPVALADQFAQSSFTADINGVPTILQAVTRNGSVKFEPVESAKDVQAEADFKMRQEEQKQQHQERQFYRDTIKDEARVKRERASDIMRLQTTIMEQRLAIATIKSKAAEAATKVDTSEAEETLKELQAALEEMKRESVPTSNMAAAPALGTPALGGSAEPDGPPQWYLDLSSGETYTAPDGVERVKQ